MPSQYWREEGKEPTTSAGEGTETGITSAVMMDGDEPTPNSELCGEGEKRG